ncbi:MAG: FadR family transcriptional regulator [Candidatus Bipolaricaulota bacterium]|nr:MAG: FadR family transcriptional regulator [Candidatus Bipolaricaulota bacterium]
MRPRKVSAVVAEQIIAAIRRGDYPVGSKLPPEFDLAELMGVSRPSVREALSALQAVGVIESKPGSGSYVRHAPAHDEEHDAPLLIESEDGCLEVMEARATLEPPVAALAAANRTSSSIGALRAAIAHMRNAASDDFGSYLDADKAFHTALAAATGNRLVSTALSPLIATIDQKLYREFTHHYYLKNVADIEQVIDLHGELLEAIERGDGEAAEERMREHWRRMLEIWEA